MKTRFKQGTRQSDTRSASGYQRKQSSTAGLDDLRTSNAEQDRLVQGIDNSPVMTAQRRQLEHSLGDPVQKVADEEELMQGKFKTLQRQGLEEEELLQGKFESLQRQPEEEELMQGEFADPVQREQESAAAPNQTGMPDNLKHGIESLAGIDMSDVRVHYNSSRPAQLNAHAFARGNDIHLGAGQEQHLPHEAWHTVQQRQGRVQPTTEVGGEQVNDDAGLEREADVMGDKASRYKK